MSQNKFQHLFVLNFKGQSFFCFRETLPSLTFNYCKSMSLKQHYPHMTFQQFSPDSIYLDYHHSLPQSSSPATLIIKDKRILSLFAKTSVHFFYCHCQYQYISLFLLYIKCILLNIHKFFKRKLSHMRWSNSFCESVAFILSKNIEPSVVNYVPLCQTEVQSTIHVQFKHHKKSLNKS